MIFLFHYIKWLLGLESHPQHDLYKRQMKGFGGMISVYLKGGLEEASVFMQSLKVNLF